MSGAQTNILPASYSGYTYSVSVESWPLLLVSGALALTLGFLLVREIRAK